MTTKLRRMGAGGLLPALATALALAWSAGLHAQGLQKKPLETLAEGAGWRLVDVDPSGSTGQNTLAWQVSPGGVANLPVSQAQKDLINAAFADEPLGPNDVIYASQEFFEAMEQPDFPLGYEKYVDVQALAETQEKSIAGFSFGCSWKTETRNRQWPYSQDLLDRDLAFGGELVDGHLRVNLPITGNLTIAATYKIRKCAGVPVGFKFVSATASGTATIAGSGSLEATVSRHDLWEKEWKLAEPELGEVNFTVGWIPVRLVFTLPIYAGVSFESTILGQASLALDASASGTFSYTCTLDDCSGTSDFTDQFEFTGPTASIEVDLKARAYARVMARVGLYSSNFAYVEGGLRAYAQARLWGYLGNNCGDADGDGVNESVRGFAGDLSWGYEFAYGKGGWLLSDSLRYKGGREFPLGWRDLLGTGGSTALQPMIVGPGSFLKDTPATYTLRMRPCYPYGDAVNVTMGPDVWTGGSVISGPPDGSLSVQRTFTSPGAVTLVATATGDAFGRDLQTATTRTIQITTNAPNAPSGLTATALTGTSVRLVWSDNSNNETAFAIQRRSLPGGSFGSLTSTAPNVTSFTDATASAGSSYEYRVRAWNGADGSAYSNVASVSTPQVAPAAPSALSATVLNPTSMRLNWTDNSNNETQFELQRRIAPAGVFATVLTAAANAVTLNDTVVANTSYEYRVRATNAAGASPYSNTASATTPDPNRPPVAVNDSASARSGLPVDIAVTANDSDPDGNPVSLILSPIVVAPANGSAVRLSNSSIRYTPNAGFQGSDTFQYEIGDGLSGRARAWVTVSVTNTAPVANPDSVTIHINVAADIAVTANDTDADGHAVTLITSPIVVAPTNGTAVKLSSGVIRYTPNTAFLGTDTFQYEIGDGNGARARAWVTVNVTNNAPVAVADAVSTRRNVAVTIAVTANDYDPDGDPVSLITAPIIVAPAHGSAVRASGSSITYTPATGYTGTDTFQYEIGDGNGRRARAWVTVTITP
jgi:hypothetical protein